MFEPTDSRKRCTSCIQKYSNPAAVTNNFWQLYPEIANLVDSDYIDKHRKVTTKSLDPITICCGECDQEFLISPKDFLELGSCIHCKKYLVNFDKKSLKNQVIEIINKSNNFEEYEDNIKSLHFTSYQLGFIQEVFAQYYFTTHAHLYEFMNGQYLSYAFDKIDIPGMPARDMGTDAIIIHDDGTKSLIQIKWKSKKVCHNRSVFYGLSIDALNIEGLRNLYLFSNSDNVSGDLPTGQRFKYILYGTLKNIDWPYFKKNVTKISNGQDITLSKIQYRDWQLEAMEFVKERELSTVTAACGTGKTIFSIGVIKQLGSKFKVLIVVPSLQLLSQWYYQLAVHVAAEYLLVGSQGPTIDDSTNDVPYMLTTDKNVIKEAIKNRLDKFIIISTYQSLHLISSSFTTIFIDEAHWTVTQGESYSIVTKFKSHQKIYLTATPKIIDGDNVLSMDNKKIYGEQYSYSCRKAIDDGILCDYNILLGICQDLEEGYPVSQRYQLYSKFLLKCVQDHKIKSILVASNSHESSMAFYNEFKKIYNGPTLLMRKNAKSSDKDHAIGELKKGCIVFNVRVFNLGVDIPCLEGVFFNGDKSSRIDIVQTASRCLRKFPGKDKAFIMVPAFMGQDLEVELGDFPNVRNTLLALGENDKAIKEEVFEKASHSGVERPKKEKRIYCIGVDDLDISDIELRLFDRMGQQNGIRENIKFSMLIQELIKHKGWVQYKYEIDGINLGLFQDRLKGTLTGRNNKYNKYLSQWRSQLEELECWPEMLKSLNDIIDNRKIEKLRPQEKFELLIQEIIKLGDWVPQKYEIDGIKLGSFQNNLKCALTGTNNMYKEFLLEWTSRLEELEFWPKMLKSLNNAVDNRKVQKLTLQEKFELLIQEIIKLGDWVPQKYEIDGIKLGVFSGNLKGSLTGYYNEYKKFLPQWKSRLEELDCYPILLKSLNNTIDNRKLEKTSPREKFNLLIQEVIKHKGWVQYKYEIDGINLGIFQDSLKGALTGRNNKYNKYLSQWRSQLEELECWPEMLKLLTKFKLTLQEKFELLMPEIVKLGSWIPTKTEIGGIKLGNFQDTLKRALSKNKNNYQKYLPEWRKQLEELECWPEMLKNLNKIIDNRKHY
jgi:superfamily II DNA or RNA helicase